MIKVAGLLFITLATVNCAIVINGCQRTTMMASGQMRCVECNFLMGVTQDGKCAYCKPGQSVVNAVCMVVRPVVDVPTIVIIPTQQTVPDDNSSISSTVSASTVSPSKNIVQFTITNSNTQSSYQAPAPAAQTQSQLQPQSQVQFNLNSGNAEPTLSVQQQFFDAPSVQNSSNVSSFSNKFGSGFGELQQDFFSSDSLSSSPPSPSASMPPSTSTSPSPSISASPPSASSLSASLPAQSYVSPSAVSQTQVDNSQVASNAPKTEVPANTMTNTQFSSSQSLASSFSIAPSQQIVQPTQPKTNPVSTSSSANKDKPVVSPFPQYPYCSDYDGSNCWACLNGYLLNLIINKCVAYVKPPSVTLAPPADPAGIKSSTPDSNCNTYSQQEQVCKQCFRNYYLNKNSKQCTPVDALCRTYDQDDGHCLSCYTQYSLQSGKCVADNP